MIHTRRSFLQRAKERNKQDKTPLEKKKDFEWTRSDEDDIDVFSSVDDNDIESTMLGSARTYNDLIVCPPVRYRNSAQDAAEALRQDLVDMGYDLDCKSFITKGSTESDSVVVERYQPPRILKPKSLSSSSGLAMAPSSACKKDIVMAMRSLSPCVTEDQKSPRKDSSYESSQEHADWAIDDSGLAKEDGPLDQQDTETKTSQQGVEKVNIVKVSSLVRKESEPSPPGQSYGSLKKIATVHATPSWNETTISTLRQRESSNDVDDEAVTSKHEHVLTVTSSISKSANSHLPQTETLPVPETLEFPIKTHILNGEAPKTPVLIEGMNFVKNTTFATDSVLNSTFSPRTRLARVKIRQIIQEKMEQNQGNEITSVKTAPAKQTHPFFVPVTKPSRMVAKEDHKVDSDHAKERLDTIDVTNDIIAEDINMSDIVDDIKAGIEECTKTEIVNQTQNAVVSEIVPIQTCPIDITEKVGTISLAVENELMLKDQENKILEVSKANKTKRPKAHRSTTPADQSRKFRPLSLFRKPLLSPKKKQKPILTPPASSMQQTAESSKHGNIATNDEIPKEESGYVGYDIETRDGVEVVAVAKMLPFVTASSTPAESQRDQTPRHTAQQSKKTKPKSKSHRKQDLEVDKGPETDDVVSSAAETARKQMGDGQYNGAQSLQKAEVVDTHQKAPWQTKSLSTSSTVGLESIKKRVVVQQANDGVTKYDEQVDAKHGGKHYGKHDGKKTIENVRRSAKPRKEKRVEPKPSGDLQPIKAAIASRNLSHHDIPHDLKNVNQPTIGLEPIEKGIAGQQANDRVTKYNEQVDGKHDGKKSIENVRRSAKPRKEKLVKPKPSGDLQPIKAAIANRNLSHHDTPHDLKNGNQHTTGTQGTHEFDGTAVPKHDLVETESKHKWTSFRMGFKGFRKAATPPRYAKKQGQSKDRHEIIQDFLDRELKGQEEHSFPSKLDPTKNAHGASMLQDMVKQKSQIPKQLIITKLDDSSCLTTETDKIKQAWHETVASPSALDAAVWDEIAEAGLIVERAIEHLEEATKNGDVSTKASSALSGEIEKALLTLKRHADRLGVTETDLLLAVKSTDCGLSDETTNQTSGKPATTASLSSFTTTQTPLTFGQDLLESIKGYFFSK